MTLQVQKPTKPQIKKFPGPGGDPPRAFRAFQTVGGASVPTQDDPITRVLRLDVPAGNYLVTATAQVFRSWDAAEDLPFPNVYCKLKTAKKSTSGVWTGEDTYPGDAFVSTLTFSSPGPAGIELHCYAYTGPGDPLAGERSVHNAAIVATSAKSVTSTGSNPLNPNSLPLFGDD